MFQVWRLDDRSNLDQTRKYLYGKENNQHIRHSKPDKFGLSIQSYLFIYFDMKHRGSGTNMFMKIMAIVIFRKRAAMTQYPCHNV